MDEDVTEAFKKARQLEESSTPTCEFFSFASSDFFIKIIEKGHAFWPLEDYCFYANKYLIKTVRVTLGLHRA